MLRFAQWITVSLYAIASERRDLQQILTRLPFGSAFRGANAETGQIAGETTYRQWLALYSFNSRSHV